MQPLSLSDSGVSSELVSFSDLSTASSALGFGFFDPVVFCTSSFLVVFDGFGFLAPV